MSQYPGTLGSHVFSQHGKDGNRWADCSCGWQSEHVFSKAQVEIQCADHASANELPACGVCLGSGRNQAGDDVCRACGGTGKAE